jgi:hypothetical protein
LRTTNEGVAAMQDSSIDSHDEQATKLGSVVGMRPIVALVLMLTVGVLDARTLPASLQKDESTVPPITPYRVGDAVER